MRVKCNANTGEALLRMSIEVGNTIESQFDLELEKEYTVYGVSVYRNVLQYLVLGESNLPNWFPFELFTVTKNDITFGWFFSDYIKNQESRLKIIIGYEELINTENHYDDLLEREPEALRVFFKRKKEIDEFS